MISGIKSILGADPIVGRLTAGHIRARFQESGKSSRTLNEYLVRFRSVLQWGFCNDLVSDISFINRVEPFPDESRKERIAEKYMEGPELTLLLSHLKQPLWCMLTEFLALSGLRFGEAAALERGDVDLGCKVIHITKTYDPIHRIVTPAKTVNSIDDVVIQPELEEVIRRILSYSGQQQLLHSYRTDLLFSDSEGKHIRYTSYNKYFRENCERVIGRHLTPHSLRHTHASLLFEQGFTLDEVSRRLRHGNSKVTKEVYIHITKRLKEKDAEKLMRTKLL